MNRMKQRKCDACEVVFFKTCKVGKNGSYCSRECRDALKVRMCEHCGLQFHCVDGQKKTCSPECRLRQIAAKNTKNVKRECRWCGKAFCVKPSRFKDKPCIYCSTTCVKSRRKFKAWMRNKQSKASMSVIPTALRAEQTGWLQKCAGIERWTKVELCGIDYGWSQRVASAVSCNKYRTPREITKTLKNEEEKTWEGVVKCSMKMPKQPDIYQIWMLKLSGLASNQRQRMRRKATMRLQRQS